MYKKLLILSIIFLSSNNFIYAENTDSMEVFHIELIPSSVDKQETKKQIPITRKEINALFNKCVNKCNQHEEFLPAIACSQKCLAEFKILMREAIKHTR